MTEPFLLNLPFSGERKEKTNGDFERERNEFTTFIEEDGIFPPESKRYTLVVTHTCPWSHKNALLVKLKGLCGVIDIVYAEEHSKKYGRGWKLEDGPKCLKDEVKEDGIVYLKSMYDKKKDYKFRPTTPVLFCTKTKQIVSNSDENIQIMINSAFDKFLDSHEKLDLFPSFIPRKTFEELSLFVTNNICDGVYRCGFADTQDAYDKAVKILFKSLDWLEDRLSRFRYVLSNTQIVDIDWRLFVTLVRFDRVYYNLFKCNVKKIKEYPNIHSYLRELYQIKGVKETVHFEVIKRNYFGISFVNPTGIVPIGPLDDDLEKPHGRDSLSCKV